MTHFIQAISPAAPLALSVAESCCLRGLKRGDPGFTIPFGVALRFLAHGLIAPLGLGLGITPRGRTALLLGRF